MSEGESVNITVGEAWQQAGGHGAGAAARSSHLEAER